MASTTSLIALILAMFCGSYISGLIPLAIPLSEARLHLVSIFGAGLLVGTALSVIIPEGVSTLYSAYVHEVLRKSTKHQAATGARGTAVTAPSAHHDESEGDDAHDPHHFVGLTLVSGFLFMLIIDKCCSRHHHNMKPTGAQHDPEGVSTKVVDGGGRKTNITATLGLVIHAAADGIALGAAATTGNVDTEIIVFLAVLLHKFPAAFALATFLLHEGLERPTIRRHLLVFSLAAPILAITTFAAINHRTADEAVSSLHSTGLALLFSAGTFLYVSTVHVLPELVVRHSEHSGDVRTRIGIEGFAKKDVLLLVAGTVLPMFLTFGHHH